MSKILIVWKYKKVIYENISFFLKNDIYEKEICSDMKYI